MVDLAHQPIVQALAWTLVHFIWQGAAIALAAFVAFRMVRESASLRYAIGVAALTAMIAAPAATFVALMRSPAIQALAVASQADAVNGAPASAGPVASTETGTSAVATVPVLRISPGTLALAVFGWLSGVAFFSLRLLGGWVVAQRLARRSVRPAAAHIQALAAHVAGRLALRRVVAVLESSAVVVPVMVGWLKPTIVLPIAALSGLTPTQVEALLAHELAHVRRHDYLVNLLQSVTEAILFYHPAVWWLSRRVRIERELCCDDLAVGVCDRLVYATALTDLASMTASRVALAATDGDLLGRVRRILGHSQAHANTRGTIMSGLAFGFVATIAIPVALISAAQTSPTSADRAQAVSRAQAQREAELHAQAVHLQRMEAERAEHVAQAARASQQTDQQRSDELKREVAELQKKLEQQPAGELKRSLEQMRHQLDAELQLKHVETVREHQAEQLKHSLAANAHTAQQAASAAEVAAARRSYQETRNLFERGLISQSQLAKAEAELERLMAKGNADAELEVELRAARNRLERSRALSERGLTSQRDAGALEAALAELEKRQLRSKVSQAEVASEARAAAQANNADARKVRDLVAARASLEEQKQAEMHVELQKRLKDMTVHIEPVSGIAANDPIRFGDTVRVTIEGEPSLPSTYRVSDDGAIRIPFLGAIKVQGLTSAQAKAAVGNQLSARRLGTASQVKVTVIRISGTVK